MTIQPAISIHALREERDYVPVLRLECVSRISIHALREERDCTVHPSPSHFSGISIHALREERDFGVSMASKLHALFQSTRSARSATYLQEMEGNHD